MFVAKVLLTAIVAHALEENVGIFDENYLPVDLAEIVGMLRVMVKNRIMNGALKAVRTSRGRNTVTGGFWDGR